MTTRYIPNSPVQGNAPKAGVNEDSGTRVQNILKENKTFTKKYPNLIKGLSSKSLSDRRKSETTLRIMDNQAKYVESIKSDPKLEATFTQNLGALVPKVIDLVRIFYPNLIAHELVDIQPLDRQNGEVVIVQPIYNNNYTYNTFTYNAIADQITGVVTQLQGQQVFKTYSDGFYASQNLAGSNAYTGATASTTNLSTVTVTAVRLDNLGIQLPVLAGSAYTQFWVTYSGLPYNIALQDISGNFTLQLVNVYDQYNNLATPAVFSAIQALITLANINQLTGLVTVTFSAAIIPALLVGGQINLFQAIAEFNYQSESGGINSLDINLKVVPVTAEPHPLNVA